ncbi:uncharacterized protein LOC120981737 [Bufo bufo]|uniref:uncharacterized protein LOC120981737 n=1 Tax=Bufo bufo TaxID=8384 RepID=UPI001ABDD741|nr:uncharacterized protein LOC120981737 [Bufo bufo]
MQRLPCGNRDECRWQDLSIKYWKFPFRLHLVWKGLKACAGKEMKEKLTLPPSHPLASIFLLSDFTARRDMDSMVTVFELQKDCSVKQHTVPLTFNRVNKSRLYVVTNQNTQLHLLNHPVGSPRPEEGGDAFQKKTIFQHGMSTKVLSIMDATAGTAWEVRVLLSPLEISRLSSNFNLTGFVKACLTMEEYQKSLSPLCDVQKLCMAAAQFLSFTEDGIVNDYCKELNRLLTEKVGASHIGQQEMNSMVFGALVALVAAELAASSGGTRSFDYRPKKENTQEDQREQIQEMVKVFDVMVDLLSVSHQRKRLQILFRNPCPDNWASGGKTLAHSGETFVFGLSHKVVSISEAESEIQFLQNLQESYDLISVFHLPALVEHLLMTSTWRNKIELFLKEKNQRKEIIHELSTLAERFICSKICKQIFLKEFQKEMFKKWLSAQVFLEGDEVVCCFGILVAILAAVIAKSIADRPTTDSEEEEGPEEPAAELVDSNRSSSSTSLDDSISSFEVILTTVSDEYGGAQPNLYCSPGELVKVEDKSGEEGIGGVESKIDRNNDSGTTYQGNIDGCLKTTESLAELPDVGLIDIADQKADCDTADENFDVYPDSKDDSNEDGNCIGDCSVAESPSEGTPENALEPQVPSENRVFYTSFLGLMFLLVVTMLSNVFPQSVGSILVAIILGLLIVKWLTSQQP